MPDVPLAAESVRTEIYGFDGMGLADIQELFFVFVDDFLVEDGAFHPHNFLYFLSRVLLVGQIGESRAFDAFFAADGNKLGPVGDGHNVAFDDLDGDQVI